LAIPISQPYFSLIVLRDICPHSVTAWLENESRSCITDEVIGTDIPVEQKQNNLSERL
jgi:hypothetical protein